MAFYSIVTQGQIINIPDANFKAGLLNPSNFIYTANNLPLDANTNGEIEESEALQVTSIQLIDKNIASISGIEFFTNLTFLDLTSNNLTSVDVSMLTNLITFSCLNNDISTLNVSNLTNLIWFECGINQLTSLNLTGLNSLGHLSCSQNQISSLNFNNSIILKQIFCGDNPLNSINLSGLINLETLVCYNTQLTTLNLAPLNYGGISKLKSLDCSNNQLTNLDLTGKIRLTRLKCNNNLLTSINVANFPDLQKVYCDHNLITTLDFSTNPLFNELSCSNNNLTTIKINNGANQVLSGGGYLGDCFDNNPNLNLICADATEITPLQSYLTACGNTQNITINTTCSLEVEAQNSPKTTFFPNPTHDKVYFDNSVNRYDHVMVYNSLGQLILNKKIDFSFYETIDLSGFTKGIYLIKSSNAFENQTSTIVKE